MNKNTIPLIYKWLCVLLVVLSILLISLGGITIADKDSRRTVKKGMKEVLNEIDFSSKEIKEFQEQLDNWGIDINAKKILKQVQKLAKTISDATVSTLELAINGPDVISFAEEAEDYARIGSLVGVIPKSVIESIEDTRAGIWFGVILFYLTMVTGIVTIILHIANKKQPGVVFAILQLVWLIALGAISHNLNVMAEDELYLDDELVTISAGPVWAFILALLACLLWMFKDSILGAIGWMTGVSYASSAAVVSGNVCPNCGKVLGPNAMFCTGCGSKFTPPVPVKAPVSAAPTADNDNRFCPNCGAAVTSDSDFCTQCGTKL